MTVSLAFVAPDIVEAAIAGRLPHGIVLNQLTDLPPEWSRQRAMRAFGTPGETKLIQLNVTSSPKRPSTPRALN